MHRVRTPAHVHQHERGARVRDDARERRIVAQPADLVDDGGAFAERRTRDAGLHRIDRQRHANAASKRLQHRHDARQLVVQRHGRRARPRGLAADVDQIGAVRFHLQRGIQGGGRIETR